MKPTKLLTLLGLVGTIATVSFFVARIVVANGLSLPVSPNNLIITLSGISALVLILTVPIWKYKNLLKQVSTSQRPKRVDPFYAVRVLLLAKASSIAGAVFAGWHLGVLIAQTTLPVGATALIVQNTVAFVASVILSASGLVAEQICKLPEDKDPEATDQAVTS
jgi:hypothetical protein